MTDLPEPSQEKVNQLQMIEQNLRSSLLQRQNFQSQLVEVESALAEIGKTKSAYKIVGNIMVASSKEDLQKELKEKKEVLYLRIKSLEKQEEKLREQASKIQSDVLKDMEKQKGKKK